MGVTTPQDDYAELRQFIVNNGTEFTSIAEKMSGYRNLYSSISVFRPVVADGEYQGNSVTVDKVSLDLDSSAKALPEAEEDWDHSLLDDYADDDEVIEQMRANSEVAHVVLGDVCDDARRLADRLGDEGKPFVGVFSGLGLHIHQLYQPTRRRPENKMASVCKRYISELTLSTADEKASGKPFRIMRVPNIERVAERDGEPIQTGLYTIPLLPEELDEVAPEWLLRKSENPRRSLLSGVDFDRPELRVDEDYIGPDTDEELGQEKMRDLPDKSNATAFSGTIVKEVCKMPCVYEHALGTNPDNDVRVKTGIMLLNAGYSVEEATRIISGLNWVDFDWETTKYQLERLYESGKGDWSCSTMQSKGLCARADEPRECPTYGYRGGNKPWQTT